MMPGPSGSPRVALAAIYLIEQPGLSIEEAMRRAKYPAKACKSRRKQKNVSQKKRRIMSAASMEVLPRAVELTSSSNASSSITAPLSSSSNIGGGTTSTTNKENVSRKSNVQKVLTQKEKMISADTRRTPHQVLKAQKERNRLVDLRKEAHEWALDRLLDVDNTQTAKAVVREASEKFNIQVLGNTILKMRRTGSNDYVGQGRKAALSEDHLKAISDGIMGWVTIGQMNGDPEKKNSDMVNIVAELLKGSAASEACPKWLWCKIKACNAAFFDPSKEQMVELRRQQWTTFTNLKDWFIAFRKFCLEFGFATEVKC
jgi:hypothetical protein